NVGAERSQLFGELPPLERGPRPPRGKRCERPTTTFTGGPEGRGITRPRRVLYIDGEMPTVALQERYTAVVISSGADAAGDRLRKQRPVEAGRRPSRRACG